jgi:hypothetical protein
MNLDRPFIDVDEYQAKYAGRMFGVYAAIVKDIDDPKRLGRVRVLCPSVYGEDKSPWCTACFPTALGVDSGNVSIPPLHSYVWVTFEEGDARSPIFLGGFGIETRRGRDSDLSALEDSDNHQDNGSPLPLHAQGLPDGNDTEGTLRDYRNIPTSSFRGDYGKVHVNRTEKGNVIELNDSDNSTRIFISHGTSGAFYEIRHDGTIVESTSGLKRTLDAGIHAVHEGKSEIEYDSTLTGSFGGKVALDFVNTISVSLGEEETINLGGGANLSLSSFDCTTTGSVSFKALSTATIEAADGITFAAGGNRSDITTGSIDSTSMNTFDPSGLTSTMSFEGLNGIASFRASDRSGIFSKGIECLDTGAPNVGDVFVGSVNFTEAVIRRSPTSVPLKKEGVVMGTQLQIALGALTTILTTYAKALSLGGTTPGFGGPNPVLAAANIALGTAIDGWIATYGVPLPPRAQPLYASDTVFVNK